MTRSFSSFFFLSLLTIAGCNDTAFNSATNGKSKGKDAGRGNPDATPREPGFETPQALDNQGSLDGTGGNCSGKPTTLNVLMILDASSSQAKSDPSNVRISGGTRFVEKMLAYRVANPSTTVKVNVITFSETAQNGSAGWVEIKDQASADSIISNVKASSNLSKGTNYLPAFQKAETTLAANSSVSATTARKNFILFLSDGSPSDEGEYLTAVNNLVSSKDLAIIAIASGLEIDSEGEGYIRQLALPTSNTKDPKHVGLYVRAPGSEEIIKAWDTAFEKVLGCK